MSTPGQHLETIAGLWRQFAKERRPTTTRPNPEYLRVQAAIRAEADAFSAAMRSVAETQKRSS